MENRMKSLSKKIEKACVRLDIPVTNDLVIFFWELWDRGYITNDEALHFFYILEKGEKHHA